MGSVSTQDVEALYRAAVGAEKADFYVPKFIQFDQPGASELSWNWPAFFVPFLWFLYRRMYATWAICSLAIPFAIGVATAFVAGLAGAKVGSLFYAVAGFGYYFAAIPAFANSLYHKEVKDRIDQLRERVPETNAQLLVLNNTSPTSNVVWIALAVVGFAFIGILAAIVIPAYQNYTIRAQVAETIPLAEPLKSAVVMHYRSDKSWPANIEELGFSPATGRYVTHLNVDRGTINVTFGNRANPLIAGHTLSFRPAVADNGPVIWTCGYASSDGYEDSATGPNLTDVPRRFLLVACR
jgi:type IV pilus assembly protein PilA